MKKMLPLSLALLTGMWLSGCDPELLDDLEWKPQVLTPLVTTTVNFYDLNALNGVTGQYTIAPERLGIPDFRFDVAIDVPPLGPIDLPPNFISMAEYLTLLEVNAARVDLTLNNAFPIPVGAGTRIVCQDSLTGAEVFSYTLPETVAPGGEIDIPVTLADAAIPTRMAILVKDFVSPGAAGVIFSLSPLTIQAKLQVLDLKQAHVRPGLEFELEESVSDFSLDLEELKDTAAIGGTLSVYIDHRFPAEAEVFAEFLDENGATLLTVFPDEPDQTLRLPAAPVDANGEVTQSVRKELIDFIHLKSDLQTLLRATQIRVQARLATPSGPQKLVIDADCSITLKVTGRLEIEPSNLGQ